MSSSYLEFHVLWNEQKDIKIVSLSGEYHLQASTTYTYNKWYRGETFQNFQSFRLTEILSSGLWDAIW